MMKLLNQIPFGFNRMFFYFLIDFFKPVSFAVGMRNIIFRFVIGIQLLPIRKTSLIQFVFRIVLQLKIFFGNTVVFDYFVFHDMNIEKQNSFSKLFCFTWNIYLPICISKIEISDGATPLILDA